MKRSGFKRKRNKYGAIKTQLDGIMFDSKLESEHYAELRLLEAGKRISELELQKDLDLKVNGKHVCTYIADFFYHDNAAGRYVVSEAKGVEQETWKIKWKLAQACFPEFIFELRKKWKVTRENEWVRK